MVKILMLVLVNDWRVVGVRGAWHGQRVAEHDAPGRAVARRPENFQIFL